MCVCTDISIGTVRLIGGSFTNEGRVEIFYGTWGTVCDDSWDLQDATVVCQELGWLQAVTSYHYPQFGLGTGQIWMENVQCTGNESRLYQCFHNEIGRHTCRSTRPASVQCTSNHNVYIHSISYFNTFIHTYVN